MTPEINLTIELVPFVRHDLDTGIFVAQFLDFPRAKAEGNTYAEAVKNLEEIFTIMASENNDEIVATVLQRYKRVSKRASQRVKEVRIQGLTDKRVMV